MSRRPFPTRRGALGVVLAGAAALLAGCGKKPSAVSAPESLPDDAPYPRRYPNPERDPKPGQPAPGWKFP